MAQQRAAPSSTPVGVIISTDSKVRYRMIVMVAITAYFVQNTFKDVLLPNGQPREWKEKFSAAPIDYESDDMRLHHGKMQKMVEDLGDDAEDNNKKALLKGPETILVRETDGTIFTMNEEGKLLKITDLQEGGEGSIIKAKVSMVNSLGMGRPLGGAFTSDAETLYIADSHLGLTRLRNYEDPTSKVELVTSTAIDKDGNESQILYANDVVIGPNSGKVYFTDSSEVVADRIGTKTYDTMYGAKVDLLRGYGTGRLIEYDPSTDETKVLVSGIHFANGVGVDRDESFLLYVETFGLKLWKYYLSGDQAGTTEVVLDHSALPGYLDGATCVWIEKEGKTKCYAALISAMVPIHNILMKLPDPIDLILRSFIMMLPRFLAPPTKQYGGFVEVDPFTKEYRIVQDPTGQDVTGFTATTYYQGKVYLGSLTNKYIGVYNLEK